MTVIMFVPMELIDKMQIVKKEIPQMNRQKAQNLLNDLKTEEKEVQVGGKSEHKKKCFCGYMYWRRAMGIKKGTKLTGTPKNVLYQVRVDEETDRKAKEVCQREGISKSEVVRQGIELKHYFLESEVTIDNAISLCKEVRSVTYEQALKLIEILEIDKLKEKIAESYSEIELYQAKEDNLEDKQC